ACRIEASRVTQRQQLSLFPSETAGVSASELFWTWLHVPHFGGCFKNSSQVSANGQGDMPLAAASRLRLCNHTGMSAFGSSASRLRASCVRMLSRSHCDTACSPSSGDFPVISWTWQILSRSFVYSSVAAGGGGGAGG